MQSSEFILRTNDNLKLQGRSWIPDTRIKAVVCLVHGLGEHSGRYDHVAGAFNAAGYTMLSFDLRGHGRSEGKRGHANGYAVLMSDVSKLLKTAKERHPDVPVFLYGHSLGGNLVIHYALRQRPELAGIIATAPLFRTASKPSAWKMAILRAAYGLCPSLSISSGLEAEALSHDETVVQTYRNDPLVHGRISALLAMDMLRNGEWNLQHAAELPCPLLLMHGDADRITSAGASHEFASKAGAACTLEIWNGFFHELHNEPGKKDVLAFALEWMAGRLH